MTELVAMCESCGFKRPKTYIASGNVIFESALSESEVKAALEARLEEYAGKPVAVIVRTITELKNALDSNPFPEAEPSRLIVLFLNETPPQNVLEGVTGRTREVLSLGKREIYINYVDGIGDSKLKFAALKVGTGRNMNTVGRLIALASETCHEEGPHDSST